MKEFDLEEVAQFDGKDGKPVYVAHKGRVFDVSGSKLWKGGLHMKRHHAGTDLTVDIGGAPHGPEILKKFPQVGTVRKKKDERKIPKIVSDLLNKYPMMRRHPHPMTVHFPIVFMLSAPLFSILYLLTGNESFEATSFHCLAMGVLITPVVILTGLFSWWLNYMAKRLKAVDIKMATSFVLLVVSFMAAYWRLNVPDILVSFRLASVIYLLLMLSLAPLVIVIGWHGAKLTFPIERE